MRFMLGSAALSTALPRFFIPRFLQATRLAVACLVFRQYECRPKIIIGIVKSPMEQTWLAAQNAICRDIGIDDAIGGGRNY
jgi:hypothetical protein